MKKYYKVVRRDGERFVSAIMGEEIARELERDYSTTAWTRGVDGTPVMAFESKSAAQGFACGRQVWQAQVRRPRKIVRLGYYEGDKSKLLAFWKRVRGKRWYTLDDDDSDVLAHTSTVACEAIRLVRPV